MRGASLSAIAMYQESVEGIVSCLGATYMNEALNYSFYSRSSRNDTGSVSDMWVLWIC